MTDCVICSEAFENGDNVLILPCHPKHYFHYNCGVKCLEKKPECPLCREDYSEQIIKHITSESSTKVSNTAMYLSHFQHYLGQTSSLLPTTTLCTLYKVEEIYTRKFSEI